MQIVYAQWGYLPFAEGTSYYKPKINVLGKTQWPLRFLQPEFGRLFMDEGLNCFRYALEAGVRTQTRLGLLSATYNNISLMDKLQADLKDGDVQKVDEITEVVHSHPVIDILR